MYHSRLKVILTPSLSISCSMSSPGSLTVMFVRATFRKDGHFYLSFHRPKSRPSCSPLNRLRLLHYLFVVSIKGVLNENVQHI